MVSLSEQWAHGLASHGIISAEDEALYSYGLRQGAVFLLNIATTLCIGWLLGMVKESVVFMLSYLPLRRMAGGYHARTQLRCYLLGMVLTVSVLLAAKWLPWNGVLCSVLLVAASAIIVWLAPVEDSNKPLDEVEKAYFGKRTRQLLLVAIVAYVALAIGTWTELAKVVLVALTALDMMLLLGKLRQYIKRLV